MESKNYVRENFKKNVRRLSAGVRECGNKPTDLMVDGLIQRFEFCTDFALRTCREYLDVAGHHIEGDPKAVLKKASDIGLIENHEIWMNIIADRETSAHIYDKASARKISNHIKQDYITVFQALANRFS